MRQADLLRAVRAADKARWEAAGQKTKPKEITKNSISNAYRGLHTSTRTLQKIAHALNLPFDMVLVSPARRTSNEERLRLAMEAARRVLLEDDARRGRPGTTPDDVAPTMEESAIMAAAIGDRAITRQQDERRAERERLAKRRRKKPKPYKIVRKIRKT